MTKFVRPEGFGSISINSPRQTEMYTYKASCASHIFSILKIILTTLSLLSPLNDSPCCLGREYELLPTFDILLNGVKLLEKGLRGRRIIQQIVKNLHPEVVPPIPVAAAGEEKGLWIRAHDIW